MRNSIVLKPPGSRRKVWRITRSSGEGKRSLRGRCEDFEHGIADFAACRAVTRATSACRGSSARPSSVDSPALPLGEFPHTSGRHFFGPHNLISAQCVCSPANIILPRVEEVSGDRSSCSWLSQTYLQSGMIRPLPPSVPSASRSQVFRSSFVATVGSPPLFGVARRS